jgi:hypothetical protein
MIRLLAVAALGCLVAVVVHEFTRGRSPTRLPPRRPLPWPGPRRPLVELVHVPAPAFRSNGYHHH